MGGRSRARAAPSGARRLLRRRRRGGRRRRVRDGEALGFGRSVAAARRRGSLWGGGEDRRVSALGCRAPTGGAGGSRPRPDWFRTRAMGSARERPPGVRRGGPACDTEWVGADREHIRIGGLERARSHATPQGLELRGQGARGRVEHEQRERRDRCHGGSAGAGHEYSARGPPRRGCGSVVLRPRRSWPGDCGAREVRRDRFGAEYVWWACRRGSISGSKGARSLGREPRAAGVAVSSRSRRRSGTTRASSSPSVGESIVPRLHRQA